MFDLSVPQRLLDLIERELERGERIEWIGMPRRVFFTPATTGAFLFGIPWTAFALFWTAGAAWGTASINEGPGLFSCFPLFGVPFILVGCGMLSSPIWAYVKAGKSAYVITDRRAISFEGGRSTTIRSFPPQKLTNIYRKEKRDGSGDVIFDTSSWRDSDGDRHSQAIGFLRVPDVRDVERRLKELAKKAGKVPLDVEKR